MCIEDKIIVVDEKTGEEVEIDVSLLSASRTMEEIKRFLVIINDSRNKSELIIEKLCELENIILEKARYMERLFAIKIKLFNTEYELINDFEKYKPVKDNYIYNYYLTHINSILGRKDFGSVDARLDNILDALRSIERGIAIVGEDELLISFRKMIIDEYNSVKPKNRTPLT